MSSLNPPKISRPETRFIGEYVAAKFTGLPVALGYPLGPEVATVSRELPIASRLRHSRPWRPEVDAVVWRNGVLLLIEAKLSEYLFGLAKLPLYKALVATTPELEAWRSWEVRMRLVVPRAKAWVEQMAEAAGVEIDLYEPPWITEYWDWKENYWTRPYRQAREARNQLRRNLGLE